MRSKVGQKKVFSRQIRYDALRSRLHGCLVESQLLKMRSHIPAEPQLLRLRADAVFLFRRCTLAETSVPKQSTVAPKSSFVGADGGRVFTKHDRPQVTILICILDQDFSWYRRFGPTS
jgi:hypothetical protein